MADEKKISGLTEATVASASDEFVMVNKAVTSGADASATGQTSKITLGNLRTALFGGSSGSTGNDMFLSGANDKVYIGTDNTELTRTLNVQGTIGLTGRQFIAESIEDTTEFQGGNVANPLLSVFNTSGVQNTRSSIKLGSSTISAIQVGGGSGSETNWATDMAFHVNEHSHQRERMRITSDGNVGIGTSEPVADDARSKYTTLAIGDKRTTIHGVNSGSTDAKWLSLNENCYISGGDNSGGGDWKSYEMTHGSSNIYLHNGSINFRTTANTTATEGDLQPAFSEIAMRIDKTGNVGIGTDYGTSPDGYLHITGNHNGSIPLIVDRGTFANKDENGDYLPVVGGFIWQEYRHNNITDWRIGGQVDLEGDGTDYSPLVFQSRQPGDARNALILNQDGKATLGEIDLCPGGYVHARITAYHGRIGTPGNGGTAWPWKTSEIRMGAATDDPNTDGTDDGAIVFSTATNVHTGGELKEAMRVHYNQNVGIGTAAPHQALTVVTPSNNSSMGVYRNINVNETGGQGAGAGICLGSRALNVQDGVAVPGSVHFSYGVHLKGGLYPASTAASAPENYGQFNLDVRNKNGDMVERMRMDHRGSMNLGTGIPTVSKHDYYLQINAQQNSQYGGLGGIYINAETRTSADSAPLLLIKGGQDIGEIFAVRVDGRVQTKESITSLSFDADDLELVRKTEMSGLGRINDLVVSDYVKDGSPKVGILAQDLQKVLPQSVEPREDYESVIEEARGVIVGGLGTAEEKISEEVSASEFDALKSQYGDDATFRETKAAKTETRKTSLATSNDELIATLVKAVQELSTELNRRRKFL